MSGTGVSGPQGLLGSASDLWYDPNKLAAAIAAQGPGADGRTVLDQRTLDSILNSIKAPTFSDPMASLYGTKPGQVVQPTDGSAGQWLLGDKPVSVSKGADGANYFTNDYDNPTGNGSKDKATIQYRIDPTTGQAVPVPGGADNKYNAGWWTDGGRLFTELAAAVGTAGLAGAYLGGGAAVGGAATPAAGTTAGGLATDATGATVAEGAAGGGYGSAGAAWTPTAAGGLPPAAAGGGLQQALTQAATSSLIPGISNASLLQAGVGLAGAFAGGSKGLNSSSTSTQNQVDPKVGQYVYGADGKSGLLGNVNTIMNSQLSTGGLNANQSQGLQMQLDALKDPQYGASLQNMRNVGNGLLGAPIAGNPFTQGQAQMPQVSQAQPAQAWQPLATQLNQPKQTGLLGNLRPYGK